MKSSNVSRSACSPKALERKSSVPALLNGPPVKPCAARQRKKPMNEMLSAGNARPELDPVGSLIDADFGAYYNWLNQQRLPGANQASFLAWFEGPSQALTIGTCTARR